MMFLMGCAPSLIASKPIILEPPPLPVCLAEKDSRLSLSKEFIAKLDKEESWKDRSYLLGTCLNQSIHWIEEERILRGK
jgi:hypothetical protein